MADHNIDNMPHDEQARRHLRVVAGYDSLTNEYALLDVNVDGKQASRNYVWDSNTMSWVAMAANFGAAFVYDEIDLTYTGSNVTRAVYSANGEVVATIDITYNEANQITKVVRS